MGGGKCFGVTCLGDRKTLAAMLPSREDREDLMCVLTSIQQLPSWPEGFTFTSLQVNDGPCDWHRDGPNAGWSVVVTSGDFSGGRLQVEDVFLDAWLTPKIFDGKRWHKTEDYSGTRFVMVWVHTWFALATSEI